jgi:hypothetical protein
LSPPAEPLIIAPFAFVDDASGGGRLDDDFQ